MPTGAGVFFLLGVAGGKTRNRLQGVAQEGSEAHRPHARADKGCGAVPPPEDLSSTRLVVPCCSAVLCVCCPQREGGGGSGWSVCYFLNVSLTFSYWRCVVSAALVTAAVVYLRTGFPQCCTFFGRGCWRGAEIGPRGHCPPPPAPSLETLLLPLAAASKSSLLSRKGVFILSTCERLEARCYRIGF